jgi:hypothetical protein
MYRLRDARTESRFHAFRFLLVVAHPSCSLRGMLKLPAC